MNRLLLVILIGLYSQLGQAAESLPLLHFVSQAELAASKKQLGSLWLLDFSARANSTTVTSVLVNRGNCRPVNNVQFPIVLNFGRTFELAFRCNPIEAQVQTDQGTSTFSWGDAEIQNGISVDRSRPLGLSYGIWHLEITSHIDSVAVRDVSVNRGNCRLEIHWAQTRQPMRFGDALWATAYCDVIEVQVITDNASATFELGQ